MSKKRKTHSPAFKAKLALESVQGLKTVSEIASQHSVHVSQLQKWKKHLLENASTLFEDGRTKTRTDDQPDPQLLDQLYQQIGKLQVELEFVKKKSALFQ